MKKMDCEKCKKHEGTECVYYSAHEGYLCKSCHRKWLKIARVFPVKNNDYGLHEKKYLKWIEVTTDIKYV